MAVSYSVIGKPAPVKDAIQKVTGSEKYTGDLKFPHTLHGKVLGSPYPHARILNIDTRRAEKLPGVKAVVTGKDTLKRKYGMLWARVGRQWMEEHVEDRYPLCFDKVLHIGDAVAGVAAVDEETAEEALDLIKVEYDVLPAVFDPWEAMQDGAPQLYDDAPHNLLDRTRHIGYGNVEEGFRKSDYIREDTFKMLSPVHGFIEPMVSVASWDTATQGVTLWTASEVPNWVRWNLHELLDIPLGKIVVNKPVLGGGFGGKTNLWPSEFCCVLLSRKTGRPVRIVMTVEETFMVGHRRCDFNIWIKTGLKKDGTLMAREAKILGNGGAYAGIGIMTVSATAFYLHFPLKIPNFRAEATRVYTNTPYRSVFRGTGNEIADHIDTIHLDLIARDLGIDPVELRLKNCYQKGAALTPLGFPLDSYSLDQCINKAVEKSGYRQKKGKLPPNHGIGLGHGSDVVGFGIPPGSFCPSMVKLHEGEKVSVIMSTWEMGQSIDTQIGMIVAEVLGVNREDVEFVSQGTADYPTDTGSSNEGTFDQQSAYRAALEARKQLFEYVAQKFNCSPDDLESRDRQIYVKSNPAKKMPFFQAVESFGWEKGTSIIGQAAYYCGEGVVNVWTKRARGVPMTEGQAYSAYIVEVELDPETGVVKPEKVTAAYDVGTAINPLVVEGQIQGGVSMGMGTALWEGVIHNEETGQVMNGSFLKYKLSRAADAPDIEPVIVQEPEPSQPFGLKSCGMGVYHPAPGSFASAILDVTKATITEYPMTPDVILQAMEKKEKK